MANNLRDPSYPQGSTPVPDPTVLTTQQLVREIAASREIIETRLNAMDVATDLNKKATDKIPCAIGDAIRAVKELFNEKFDSIAIQFKERDTRTEQTRASDKIAVDAALQAQKEAAGATNESAKEANSKTEQNFTKLLDQIGQRVDELKGRLDRGEGSTGGRQNERDRVQFNNSWVWPMLVIGLTQAATFMYLVLHK